MRTTIKNINLIYICYIEIPITSHNEIDYNDFLHTYIPLPLTLNVAKTSQIFLRHTHFYQNDLAMRNTADVTVSKPIAV
jgi:hypothetical protein